MITLNTDSGLVQIESWDDVETIPGFVPELDSSTAELELIIGSYQFADFVSCGLSSCRQKHGRGYVVQAKDGRKTNIGKDCGARHFGGVDFEAMRRRFDRDLRAKQHREQLTSTQHQAPGYLQEILALKDQDKGATWLQQQLTKMRDPDQGLPARIWDRINVMVKQRDSSIQIHRLATAVEREAIIRSKMSRYTSDDDADDNRPIYVTDTVGNLRGLPFLFRENNLRELLVLDLQARLKELVELDVSTMSERSLSEWVRWVDEIESKFTRARQAIEEGRALFSASNLSQLSAIATDSRDRNSVTAFSRKFS